MNIKAMIEKNVIQIIAEVPEPRDGMTLDVLRGERVVVNSSGNVETMEEAKQKAI